MKRTMGGGSHRGPVAIVRQRRTIRFVQFSLILLAAAALMLAGYSWGRARGFEQGRTASRIGAAPPASATETDVLAILGLGAFAGSMLLRD
ncbi:MAG: hypothetical protein M3P18_17720, partial [Actinomycetota bacterium]|nr:hypothetical protein [Actinomycetota bacterium]